ncbi:MAG: hypothetical protein IJ261_05030, partial [Clostridia bacterium]|nr:hypothetical protein [Clostridia bacterium]
YNYIHTTCLEAQGAAAIDSPARWDCYGNFVRYNLISTLGNGSNELTAVKACSGSEVRGNMFVNILGTAMDFAGGRNINFTNNIVVNCTVPIRYLTAQVSADDPAWKELTDSPYKSETWKKAYPDCYSLITDYSKMTDPAFAVTPANSTVQNNIILQARADIGEISSEAKTYSVIDTNMVLELSDTNIFIDGKGGNYRINEKGDVPKELPEFRDIPFDSIGRY